MGQSNAIECFEVYEAPCGASCVIFGRDVVCYIRLNNELFSSPIRTVYTFRGDFDLDIENNKIRFNKITNYEFLDSTHLLILVMDLYSHTGINYMDNIWNY